MLIYIRHADDHDDDAEHRHDRHLAKGARKQARKLAKRLIKKHGHPTAIYVSPFQRTLETVEALSARFAQPVPVHQDPRLSRLFSKKQQLDPDVSPQTARAVSIVEDREAFHRRVQEHAEDMRRAGYHSSHAVIWCITHKIVVRDAARHFGVDVPKDVDFLDYIVVRS
jgi:broad specificity phosphatase PhoE